MGDAEEAGGEVGGVVGEANVIDGVLSVSCPACSSGNGKRCTVELLDEWPYVNATNWRYREPHKERFLLWAALHPDDLRAQMWKAAHDADG